jgi:hypothetical protein
MQLTVTRNRKTSENYNSQGHGISLTVELDQGLLSRPGDLQDQVAQLYREADAALDRQAGGEQAPGARKPRTNGNGAARRGTMTASQRRAIDAIGRRLGLEVAAECKDQFGTNLDELDVRTASTLIDHLKSLQHAGPQDGDSNGARGNGGRR